MDEDRSNDFMRMLENEMLGENAHDATMILALNEKKRKKNGDIDRDNTLISYKESEKEETDGRQRSKIAG